MKQSPTRWSPTRWLVGVGIMVTGVGLAGYLYATQPSSSSGTTSASVTLARRPPRTTTTAGTTGQCSARPSSVTGPLPDPTCTPGATNPKVTQANISSTICMRGWTATIRPPVSYTNTLKRQQIAQYGYLDNNLRDYEEDHLISLELGGDPRAPANLWPEPGASPNPKDSVENRLRAEVCAGKVTLHDAQVAIATNWTTAP